MVLKMDPARVTAIRQVSRVWASSRSGIDVFGSESQTFRLKGTRDKATLNSPSCRASSTCTQEPKRQSMFDEVLRWVSAEY